MSPDELSALYAHLGPRLLRLSSGLLGDSGEAAEVLQEAFLRAWQRDPGPDPAPWLATVCLNLCRDRLRTRSREARALAGKGAPSTEAKPEDRELEKAVRARLDALPEREREAFLLVAMGGLSSVEAGQAMGCSPEAVRMALARARRALSEALKGEFRVTP